MSMFSSLRMTTTRLAAVGLLVAGATSTVFGAAPALQGQLTLRPVTPQDIKDYTLTGVQGASGLATIGLGQPAYLDVLVNNAVTNSDITNVTWTLTTKPVASTVDLQASPLGANVPPFKMADRFNNSGAAVYKVASRMLLRPDAVGQYTVTVSVKTASSGSTNLTQKITAATYLGIAVCSECHDGGTASDMMTPWSQSPHATFFARAVDGVASDHYSKNCISCHLVGYDTNALAVNGGFDDIAKALGWTFPAVLTNGNWAAMPAELKNVANIQCENCHGPGSQHAAFNGDISRISVSYGAGDCGQCHDSKNTHYRNAEWNNSTHARVTRTPSGASRIACIRCHTAPGLADYIEHKGSSATYTTNTVYEAITCSACHDPHNDANPHQLRTSDTITLDCGFTAKAGSGAVCMNCHQSRTGSYTNSLERYPKGQFTYPGSSSFGPHDNPAADILMGVNGYTYGKEIPSSAHRFAVTNTCSGCHMQTIAAGTPAFTKAGGHTFNLTYQAVTNGLTNTVELVEVCVKCHGPMESFDLVKVDYNSDGIIEGVQTEMQKLLDKLSTYMPNANYVADGNYVGDGLVKTSLSVKTNWQAKYLQAAWNWQLVTYDASKGIHNAAYSVGLIKASIGNLNGDGNSDTLPDAWQTQYFGSPNDPKAAPNATPAGDGIPNWLKYSLGLNPTVPGIVMPDGVVWANGNSLGGGTNTIRIYTAAEIVFDTETNATYQVQATSSLSGGWKNVGDPVPGTGASRSYVTPTRQNVQQFYRVMRNP